MVSALVRGAFEFQGQKCSALSRAFLPQSIWPQVKQLLLAATAKLQYGDPADFTHLLAAVIDEQAFKKNVSYIEAAKASPEAEVLCGGYDGSKGWFIAPTIIQAYQKDYVSMREEIFGPILTVYIYEDEKLDEILAYCDTSTPYALTGAIFARDRAVIAQMEKQLMHSAGNFYINDKPTGAVVGQQPFGGARASGTNDKAGSALIHNLDGIRGARVIVAVAGMEGALPSIIGGLVDKPVIAVPTSVGYGASFNGLSALLTMLNSCAAGVSVVNIDNGFGAGYIASMIPSCARRLTSAASPVPPASARATTTASR